MKKTSVLLFDKHPATVEGIRDLLTTAYDSCVMVSDEKSLIETLGRLDPDLVVADISTPVSRASNVAGLLNQVRPGSKFIILGEYEDPDVMKMCKASGASGYIIKRSLGRELIKAIEEVQRGGTYFSSGLNERASAVLGREVENEKGK
jgi:DNA-binding NarL/FixJ family response regulator